MSEKIIDLEEVMERVQEDTELLVELFEIFEQDFVSKRDQFDTLLDAQNADELRDLAHSLKGAAGNISAKFLYATCLNLEQLADQKDLDTFKNLLAPLDQQFDDLKKEIASLRAKFEK